MISFDIRPQSFTAHHTSPQPTTATTAVTGIAGVWKVEVTSPSPPGRLSHPAE
jgi:hypothetical protein